MKKKLGRRKLYKHLGSFKHNFSKMFSTISNVKSKFGIMLTAFNVSACMITWFHILFATLAFVGQTIRSWNLDNTTCSQYALHVKQLTMNALSMVRTLDPQNDLTFLRLRSKKHEIMVSPGWLILLIRQFSKRSQYIFI